MLSSASNPSRNDSVTIRCPVCQRRRFVPSGPLVIPPHRSRRDGTIYQCPACETCYLGNQRCDECGVFCRRVGSGGLCPHCSEPVAVADLLDGVGGPA